MSAPEVSLTHLPASPFEKVQIRSLFMTGFVGAIALGFSLVLLAIPWSLLSLFGNPDSELNLFVEIEYTVPLLLLHLWLYGVLFFWCFEQLRRAKLGFFQLLGRFPDRQGELKLLFLVIPVLMFSLGVWQLGWLALAKFLPATMNPSWLSNPLLLLVNTSLEPVYKVLLLSLVVTLEPMLEEIVFRGLILQRLALKWNASAGIIISSLMFGILHVNVVGFFVFGLILSMIYRETRSLWLCWLLHCSHHAIALWAGKLSSMALLPMPNQNLEQFVLSWRLGLLYASLAAPFPLIYLYRNWPRRDRPVRQIYQ